MCTLCVCTLCVCTLRVHCVCTLCVYIVRVWPQVDYGLDDPTIAASAGTEGVKSELASPVQDLMRRLFDVEEMKRFLLEFEIDTEKMPLGKLKKSHLQVGARAVLTRVTACV